MYAVDALGDLVTPQMADQQFLDALQELDDEWEDEKKILKRRFEADKRKARGGCPDLVDEPSYKPGVEHFKRKFFIINSLLERKNLGLKITVEAHD